ncbi:uncharacterized protein LOC132717334 [Ruditapes philippinarum]|uniref:uncharacterized protein LOC132717334 n=1 Tax=Ruditapes philippinarum TaxID=129788 RepID=UPI00295AFC28|nr:uncharacterized protein LOC132717334 [Ruditapes philippinarum]
MNILICLFQNGDSMAGHMHSELVRVIRTFMAKFVKMETITAAADVTMVDFKMRTNQHDEELLAVGMKARGYLDNNDVNPQIKAQFFSKVRAFYVEMTEKMIAKFPLNDPVLKCLSFLRPEFRETTPASSGE